MERWTELTSTKNEWVKKAGLLKTPTGSRKAGSFLVEGVRSVDELLKAPDFTVEAVFAESGMSDGYLRSLAAALPAGVPAYRLSRELFARMAATDTPQGVLAIVRRRSWTLDALLQQARNPLLVMLENLQDPGNAGTILRTADCAGADGLIASRGTVDFYGAKVVRAAMGSLLHLPVVQAASLPETARELKSRGIRLLAAGLSGTVEHYEADMTGPTAILIGNEGSGLSEEALSLADTVVKIPMLGRAESLNASVAAAVILYEAVRQRRQ